jgi:Protein of unknown function (DUF2971)
MPSDFERLVGIFLPYTYERRSEVHAQNIRFVHYTSAEAAMRILKSKSVWMRNSSCMNDYMEVRHGLALLTSTYQSEIGGQFKAALNSIFPGMSAQIESAFGGATFQDLLLNTYLTAVSEHADTEDDNGRLSMWRAYGSTAPVAVVLNNHVFVEPTDGAEPVDGLKAYARPVGYWDERGLKEQFARINDNLRREADFIQAQGRDRIFLWAHDLLWAAAVSTKHRGFEEEREWRILHWPTREPSRHIRKEIVTINGIPQHVYKLPLEDIPSAGLVAAIPSLVNHIIIGPTPYPLALGLAFQELLAEAGVPDPDIRIRISQIPLRR